LTIQRTQSPQRGEASSSAFDQLSCAGCQLSYMHACTHRDTLTQTHTNTHACTHARTHARTYTHMLIHAYTLRAGAFAGACKGGKQAAAHVIRPPPSSRLPRLLRALLSRQLVKAVGFQTNPGWCFLGISWSPWPLGREQA